MQIIEELHARGHPNILGTHKMTFEITKDQDLSSRGDCVIGVNANKSARELDSRFKQACTRTNSKITLQLEAKGFTETIHGFGSEHLTFTHPHEIVGRRSSFISDRTIIIRSDKAASDINRRLIHVLKSSETELNITIRVEF